MKKNEKKEKLNFFQKFFKRFNVFALVLAMLFTGSIFLTACSPSEPSPNPPGIVNPKPDDKKEEDNNNTGNEGDENPDENEDSDKGNEGEEGEEGNEGDEKEEQDTPPVDITNSNNLTAAQKQQVINTLVPIITPNLQNAVGRNGTLNKIISIDFENTADTHTVYALINCDALSKDSIRLVSVHMENEITLNTILNSPETIKTANKYGDNVIQIIVDKEETRGKAVYDKLVSDEVIEDIGTPDYYGMKISPGNTSAELWCAVKNIHLYTFNRGKLIFRTVEVKSDVYKDDFVNEHLLEGTNNKTYRRITGDQSNFEYEFSSQALYDYENSLYVYNSNYLTAAQKQQVINTLVPIITPNIQRTVELNKIISLDFQYDSTLQKYKVMALCDYKSFTGDTIGLISVLMDGETTINTILNSPETIKTANKYGEIDIEFVIDKEETRGKAVYDKLVADGVIEDIGTPDYYGMSVIAGSTSAELNCGIHYVELYVFNKGKLIYTCVEVKSDAYKTDYIKEHLLEGTNGVTYRRLSEKERNFEYEFSSQALYDYENGIEVDNAQNQTANVF